MAKVYGNLSDYGLQTLGPLAPILRFTPSGPGIKSSKVMSSTPIEALVASDGAFMVDLEPTDGIVPDAWYELSLEHLNPTGEPTHFDLFGYRLRVPPTGGQVGNLPDVPLSPATVLVSLAPPPAGYRGWYLNAPGPGQPLGDPDDPLSSGTGILQIVS